MVHQPINQSHSISDYATSDVPECMLISPTCADSSQHVCIEDCYIRVGDDAVSIKSGWDQYGVAFGMPSKNIQIRRVVAENTHGISMGSEMSGGISNIKVRALVTIDHGPKK